MGWKDYNGLVIGMVRTGILGYGGGPSVIPLIRYEAVTRYKWVSDEEFGEILAIANALPGPIATKMAAYLGYKTKGVLGAIVSVLAHILPTSIAIIALLGSMYALRESKVVAGMVAAVRLNIFVMLGMMAYEFAMKAWKGLGKVFAALFGVIAFVLLQLLDIHPGIVIAVFLGYGVFHLDLVQRFKSKGESDKGVS